jgi:hypothetical protein
MNSRSCSYAGELHCRPVESFRGAFFMLKKGHMAMIKTHM